jgi:hypothetical protein
MYREIKHWEKTAWNGGEPDWTMKLIDIVEIQAWGGNYGNASYGIYMEEKTDHVYYIVDHQHGQYTRTRLKHLEGKHISEIANEAQQLLMHNLIKPKQR